MPQMNYDKQCVVEWNDSPETKDAVFQHLLNWYIEHGAFSGESIMQRDDPQLDAPVILSDIADDVIKFRLKDTDL